MHVPDPVISLSIKPASKEFSANFSKALARFQREDPTFRVHLDTESGETIISGMGELHLEIYVERMKREYGCQCVTGKPQVAFRETIQQRAVFDYTHKKQSGGAGQFGRVVGYIEPLGSFAAEEESANDAMSLADNAGDAACSTGNANSPSPRSSAASSLFRIEFESRVVGGAIPTEYLPACEKGFKEACARGNLIGHPIVGVKMVVEDGSHHVVDSNEYSFRTAASAGFRRAYDAARPIILEPLMKVAVTCPIEFQGVVMGSLNRRRGLIIDSEAQEEVWMLTADVPLNAMFGYSTELRSLTQGKGEFTMEYKTHRPVLPNIQAELVALHQKQIAAERK
jgi:elongation factor G